MFFGGINLIGEKVRHYGFWTLDFLKGSTIRKHYKDIKYINDGGNESEEVEKRNLKNLLIYAADHTGFYKEYRNFTSIKDFPIIDKNTIKSNYDSILSENYTDKKLYIMKTSGSTGMPFAIKQNTDKRNRVLAELIYFGDLAGYKFGKRLAFIRLWTDKNKLSFLDAFKKNIRMLNVEDLEEIRKTMKEDKHIRFIQGYASSLDILSHYLLEKHDKPQMFNIETVISIAEQLKENTRENLVRIFNCSVVSRYSNQENGILAQELIVDKLFKINKASYYIEFLKIDSNQEAKPGDVARIVVTDLFNYAMPIIRYDTGDLCLFEKHNEFGIVITSVLGRKVDYVYDTQGRTLTYQSISKRMDNFDKIKQYQFIQEDKITYKIKLNGSQGIYNDHEYIEVFTKILGKDSKISIEHVEGIPILSSGKFKQIVCNYEYDTDERKE